MRLRALMALLTLSIAGCASGSSGGTGDPSSSAPPTTATRTGGTIVSVVGTPFLIAFKIPVCVATVAIAAPLAGALALTDDNSTRARRRALGEDVGRNCGPPYVLSPSVLEGPREPDRGGSPAGAPSAVQ